MICGSVGNLPAESLDIQYAQSSWLFPDFAFPHDAIMAETTANTEMVFLRFRLRQAIHVRNEGSVNNLKDRREDLFTLKWRKPKVQEDSQEELKENSLSVRDGDPMHNRATKPLIKGLVG